MVRTPEEARIEEGIADRVTFSKGESKLQTTESPDPPEDIFGKEWPDILIPTPPDLAEAQVDAVRERRMGEVENRRDDIDNRIIETIGAGLGAVDQTINELFDFELESLSRNDLLVVIAESMRNNLLMNKLLVEQSNVQLSLLNDIANGVLPNTAVTVSGTNSIDDANAAQPIIPDSKNQDVPTRVLWVRASPGNNDDIFIGDDSVDPDDGFVLRPGESTQIEVDFRSQLLYMASGTEDQVVQLLGVF